MGRTDARAPATRPTLATSRQFLTAAVVIVVVGYAVILEQRWELTRIDWLSLILAIGALAYSYWIPDSERFIAEKVAKRDELFSQFAVLVLFLAFYSITAGSDTNPFNAHVRQAGSFGHSHTCVDAPHYIEHAPVGPYIPPSPPPLPAIPLLAFPAASGP